MIKAVIPALLIATMAVGPASAAFHTGNTILEHCRNQNKLFLLGYTMGVSDTLMTLIPERLCIPEQATAGQLVDIMCQYLENNPDSRHQRADFLTFNALFEAFPCKQ